MTAHEILQENDLRIGSSSKSTVLKIYHAADDGGTISGMDMVRLFPGRPELHTHTNFRLALIAAGCTEVD
jgi:hypothetical protein